MTLDLSAAEEYVGLPASIALATAMFEQTGLRELIDSKFDLDSRKKLSPGSAVKALIGDMVGSRGRSALFNVSYKYLAAPNELLFGKKVNVKALGGTAFSRDLDQLYELDLPGLSYECYSRLAEFYGLKSNVFNVDSTNFSITALSKESDGDAAVPERCGHAKDGRNDRLVYSLLSVTDENSVLCYECPYDGATADSVMDRGAIEFLSGKVDPKQSTLIADCKIATKPLVELMESEGFGFVAKCPDNFGKKVRSRIVESVRTGTMDPSLVRDGWEIYDTDAEVDGKTLRFVAFRTTDDITAGIEYLRDQGLREAKAVLNRFESRMYNCDIDARRDIDEALYQLSDSAYRAEWSIDEVEVSLGYGHRGRPRKDAKPLTKTEYRVSIELVFDEERAKALSQDRGVRVLVTNLPRSNADAENIRFGATPDTVLKAYLGQYRIEHAFRLMKDGMKMSRVYIQDIKRENAMMFVISLGTMIADVMNHILKSNGMDITSDGIAIHMSSLILKHDPSTGTETFMGPREAAIEYLDIVQALGLDKDHLID
jgi:transposase